MSESIPPVTPVAFAPPAYNDRSTGLIVFGVLTLLIGCLSGLVVPLFLLGQATIARANPNAANPAAMVLTVAIYGGLAAALIWLGVGSIQARRWARALLLILAWSWLVLGIIMLFVMAFIMPKIFANIPSIGAPNQPALTPEAVRIAMMGMFLFLGVIFILIPAIWVFFYGSRHVKATCEARDGVVRWTDACPLPVLSLFLWLALSAPSMLFVPLMGHGVIPFFGMFLTGVAGTLYALLLAAIWGYAAKLVYHVKHQGWWMALVILVLMVTSSLLTFRRHDVLEMYQLMGYPQTQIDQMQSSGLFEGTWFPRLISLASFPLVGYLLFVKRYFDRAQKPSPM